MSREVLIAGKTYTEHDLNCPEPGCGARMVLRPSRFGLFYGCSKFPSCKGAHGAHSDGSPLGHPADQETKQLRIKAHNLFDQLWKTGAMRRGEAYRWLQNALSLGSEEAHIGKFTKTQCELLIKILERQGIKENR